MDGSFYYWYLNGPPLPRTDPKDAEPISIDPEGMQVLDELIYADEDNAEEITRLTDRLMASADQLVAYQSKIRIQPRFVFEAARFEVIRILSLGITGFDTPGKSQRSMKENAVALESFKANLQPWLDDLKAKNPQLESSIVSLIEEAISRLEVADFDTFERAAFTRDIIEPLFAAVTDAQMALNIPTQYDQSRLAKYSTNYLSRNIHSEKLFNPFYYTQITEKAYSEDMAELGRYLFFDPILSENGQRACASCHKPELAFTDGQKKSIALDFAGTVDRNAPTLLNAALADRFFYDLRANTLESQVEHVIMNEKEFHSDYLKIMTRLRQSPEYVELFEGAFPNIDGSPINPYTISGALAAFEINLVSFNSPFDKYARGEKSEISADALAGYDLFMGKAACGTCHFAPTYAGLVPPLFHENETEILGVPSEFSVENKNQTLDEDEGRYRGIVKDRVEHYRNSFKTLTVRNAELTGPYMHNGSMETLEDVMVFYNEGGGKGFGIDHPYQTLPFDNLNLSEKEQEQIITFMKSLTDTSKVKYAPTRLPRFDDESYNNRIIGGEY